ncbi:MAG: hypothetical protein HY860_00650 [Chlamydiales bacterium]|nr:hypothetical protein [Chlamydiales bacterium]
MRQVNISSISYKNSFSLKAKLLVVINFFLIIFAYHLLRDLKDTLVVTSCSSGAKLIPFIKIWLMLPLAFLTTYLFQKAYYKLGRKWTFHLLISILSVFYLIFAFYILPHQESFHLHRLGNYLDHLLPPSFHHLTNMIRYWSFCLFYCFAELWSILVITVIFWGGLNQIIPKESAKTFYPICIALGNLSGICSGQFSYYILKLFDHYSWQTCMQLMIISVTIASILIMGINHILHHEDRSSAASFVKTKSSLSFISQIKQIFQSPSMCYIALLVISIALANNLSEVLWKNSIKNVYPDPRSYNAYINQITSIIGLLAVVMSVASRLIFQRINPTIIFLTTPIVLLVTSTCFFIAILLPHHLFLNLSQYLHISHLYLVMFLGSIHYILSLTTKYSLLDTCKEFAYLNIDQENRIQAKSIIDTIGSRLGKTGSCVFHQFLILFISHTLFYTSCVGLCVTAGLVVLFLSIKQLTTPALSKEQLHNN